MTAKEWIKENKSFFHITPTRNIESILKNGLEKRNSLGICVVRSNHPKIVEYICEMMLIGDGDSDFSIIEIKPNEINLRISELSNDQVIEVTNPLHNYILRDKIQVSRQNIVGTFKTSPFGIPNLKVFHAEINELGIIENLDIC